MPKTEPDPAMDIYLTQTFLGQSLLKTLDQFRRRNKMEGTNSEFSRLFLDSFSTHLLSRFNNLSLIHPKLESTDESSSLTAASAGLSRPLNAMRFNPNRNQIRGSCRNFKNIDDEWMFDCEEIELLEASPGNLYFDPTVKYSVEPVYYECMRARRLEKLIRKQAQSRQRPGMPPHMIDGIVSE